MSVEVNLNLEGIEEFRQAMERFDAAMQKQVQRQLAEWASNVRAEAMRLVPVQTGYLQSTIYARVHEWTTEIGAEAAYATFVEFGTRFARAKPFLYPAVQQCLPELERIVLDALDMAKMETCV